MTRRGVWPYPGDTPTAIRRRVAGAYRAALYEVDPAGCAELDARMVKWGQDWVVARPLAHELDDWLSPAEAADLACVQVWAVAKKRREGHLPARRIGQLWQYRARDVLAAFAGPGSKAARDMRDRQAGKQVIEGWRG